MRWGYYWGFGSELLVSSKSPFEVLFEVVASFVAEESEKLFACLGERGWTNQANTPLISIKADEGKGYPWIQSSSFSLPTP